MASAGTQAHCHRPRPRRLGRRPARGYRLQAPRRPRRIAAVQRSSSLGHAPGSGVNSPGPAPGGGVAGPLGVGGGAGKVGVTTGSTGAAGAAGRGSGADGWRRTRALRGSRRRGLRRRGSLSGLPCRARRLAVSVLGFMWGRSRSAVGGSCGRSARIGPTGAGTAGGEPDRQPLPPDTIRNAAASSTASRPTFAHRTRRQSAGAPSARRRSMPRIRRPGPRFAPTPAARTHQGPLLTCPAPWHASTTSCC
jgi:hypothetical protein